MTPPLISAYIAVQLCLVLLVGSQPAYATEVFEAYTTLIKAETDVLKQRILAPDRQFLIDGAHSLILDKDFRYSMYKSFIFPFSHQPQNMFFNDCAGLSPSSRPGYVSLPTGEDDAPNYFSNTNSSPCAPAPGRYQIDFLVGNEVGDPFLQELVNDKGHLNRTPVINTTATAAPLPQMRTGLHFHQNDHFSNRTLTRRSDQSGTEPWAWFGENKPPSSQAGFFINWDQNIIKAGTTYDQGWLWSVSPASGRTYPWQTKRGLIRADYGSNIGAEVDYTTYTSISPAQGEGRLERLNLVFHLADSVYILPTPTWWRMSFGYQSVTGPAPPYLQIEPRRVLPVSFSFNHHARSGRSSINASSSFKREDEAWSMSTHNSWVYKRGTHTLIQELKAYDYAPAFGLTSMEEAIPADIGTARMSLTRHSRGINYSAGTVNNMLWFRWRARAAVTGEWALPQFITDSTYRPFSSTVWRSGIYGNRRSAIWKTEYELSLGKTINRSGRVDINWRSHKNFYKTEVPEYSPSPYLLQLHGSWEFPSHLNLILAANYLGPKEIHGWGPIHTTPAHWENNMSAIQRLKGGKIILRYTLLHAFGGDILEYPGGNPLRFRVLADASIRF